MSDEGRYPDLEISNHGSIFLVNPCTDVGAKWIGQNVDTENAQWFGGALAVEHRFIEPLVEGAQASGLKVI